MPERAVRKIAAEFLRPLNQGLETIGSAMRFDDFVEKYKVTMFPTFTKGTRERYSGIIRVYLSPTFGDKVLRELTPMTVQEYIANLKVSPKTQKHWAMSLSTRFATYSAASWVPRKHFDYSF